jgi:3-hydroxybutyryl-CoA dehydratase
MSQSLRFRAPVRIGDEVVAKATVREINHEKRRVTFDCECTVGGKVVLGGEALIMVDSRNG